MSYPKHHCTELHSLSVFVHGCLASLHLLGIVYNAKRRNKLDAIAHCVGVAYSIRSVMYHAKRCSTVGEG